MVEGCLCNTRPDLKVPFCEHLFRASVRASRRMYGKGFSDLNGSFKRAFVPCNRARFATQVGPGASLDGKTIWKRDAWGFSPRNAILV